MGDQRVEIFLFFIYSKAWVVTFCILQTQDHFTKSQVFQAVIWVFFFFNSLVSSYMLYSDIFNSSVAYYFESSSEFCHQLSHFLSFWILSLLIPGSYDQKLLNCLLHPSLQKGTSCLFMNCSHVTDLANSLLSFPLGLWVFRGHQIFLSESLWVSFYILVILFWLISNTKLQEVPVCLLSRLIHQLFTFISFGSLFFSLPSLHAHVHTYIHTHARGYILTHIILFKSLGNKLGTCKHFCVVSKEILLCSHSTILKSRTF